ncbi:MAG: hypothetical protein PHU58_07425 [Prevotella sp.]|nr:hypothetical protein [Prevotella sp.]
MKVLSKHAGSNPANRIFPQEENMAKKKNDAEKLNMALSLHYLHGLSNKQITRITGLHYKAVESYLAKLERQLASGELSADDIMASAESANKRMGIEALIAKDWGKDMEPEKGKDNKELAEKLVESINKGSELGGILMDNINRKYPKNDKKEAIIDWDLPEDFQNSFRKLLDTRCTDHYAAVALQSLIDRIRSKSIVVTCLSVSEEDFSNLSINWKRVSPLKKEASK